MQGALATRLPESAAASDRLWKIWAVAVILFGVAVAVSVLFMPVWGWGMLAIAPLYLFVHRGELGGRVTGGFIRSALKPASKAIDPALSGQAAAAARPSESGLAVLDSRQRVVWCNEKSSLHLGLSTGCVATDMLAGLNPGDASAAAPAGEDRVLVESLDGRSIAVQWLPFKDAQWLLVSRDITGKEDAESGRRDLVADASHELRTPLTVMLGLLETVSELDLDRERTAYYFDLMEQQGRRMKGIVEGLLKLSKLEALPTPHREDRVNMGLLLSRIRAEAEIMSAGRHAVILEADAGVDLLGAEHEISSAVGNLVSNAVRYTLPGGEIRILWRANTQGATLSVRDTGIGIEPQHIPLLTRRFYRVEQCASRDSGGTGLGLSIVKLVLERHEAALEITSNPGKGSNFTVRFPAHRVFFSRTQLPTVKAYEAL